MHTQLRSVVVPAALGRRAFVHLQVHLGVLLQAAVGVLRRARLRARLRARTVTHLARAALGDAGGLVSQPAFKSNCKLHCQSALFTLMSSCGSVMQVRSVELHVARAVPTVAGDGQLI